MNLQEFKQREANSRTAENFKMVVVVIMVLSLFVFTAIGKENAKAIILYWAAGMVSLVVIAGVLDYIAWKKNKQIGKK